MRYGNALYMVMAARKVAPVDLARRIGRTRSYVSQLLNGGIKEPKLTIGFEIADALDVPIDLFRELMNDSDSGFSKLRKLQTRKS